MVGGSKCLEGKEGGIEGSGVPERDRLPGMISAHVVGCSDSWRQYRDSPIDRLTGLNGSVIVKVDNVRGHPAMTHR